ncbi:helix-turn-helix transcriptional regulator, partial [Lutimaribacter sp. EGI FJ00014]|nr:helix-turn-helix transcriptional regulator [Lutimaribacter sp. EGI FJ00014]
ATLRDGPQREGAVMVRRPMRRPVLIDVLPVPAAAGAPFLFGKALLVLIDLEDRPVPKEGILIRLFRMTPAEAALSVLLCSGLTLAQASDRLRITQGTVRQRLKDVFRKTDTVRQSELISLLSAVATRKPL